MFFTLKAVPSHPIYQLQDAIESFFLHCSTQSEYQLSCFPEWFRKIINRSPTLKKDFGDIADLIYSLQSDDRRLLYNVFHSVNDIENLCNDRTIIPKQLKSTMSDLECKLRDLFKKLFDDVLNRQGVFERGKDFSIRDHYRKFRELNSVCPFCGIENYKDRNSMPRNCYDHYLSESKYFFAGINFKNIVPMCENCNDTGNKGSQDILFSGAQRRETFHPYEGVNGVIIEVVCLKIPSIEDESGTWEVDIKPKLSKDTEKVSTWKDVFNLALRLEARIQEEHKNWMNIFIRRRFQNITCNENQLKKSLKQEAEKLLKNIGKEREAVLQGAFMHFIATKAQPEQLSGFCGIANSDYMVQMSKIGAGLLA